MDTARIEQLLKNLHNFQGVYSSDTLPETPSLFICNTDPSTKPGEHWIAIHVDKNGYGEYFDSFGRPPRKNFEDYMNTKCLQWTFNKRCLQSRISAFCGQYCVVFVRLRSKGFNLTKIVGLFTNDTGFNDWMVHEFVCK
jgi:hypothetical protein